MECCQEFNETEIKPKVAKSLRFIFGLILLFIGIWFSAQTEMKGNSLGYLLILTAPFAFMD